MTTFSRFYNDAGVLQVTTMDELEVLLNDERNKVQISDLIYHRYYNQYLKIFDYKDNERKIYIDSIGNEVERSIFNMEFKNGFAMMTNCCLLIETLASYLSGINKTPKKKGVKAYKRVFEKAKVFNNDLGMFLNEPIYGCIRNGLLHQGETYGGFKIRRIGPLLEDNVINATLFLNELNRFLRSYCTYLSSDDVKWDDEIWRKCRDKLKFIISNSRLLNRIIEQPS